MAIGKAGADRLALRSRPQHRTVYSGTCALVTGPTGLLDQTAGTGFYAAGTRMLSRLEWFCDGEPFDPMAFSPIGNDRALLYAQLPSSERLDEHAPYTEVSSLQAELTMVVGAGLRIRACLTNHAHADADVVLQLLVDADFTGTAEAMAGERDEVGPIRRSFDAAAGSVTFRPEQERLDRSTTVRVVGGAQEVSDDGERLSLRVGIPARGEHVIDLVVVPHANGQAHPAPPGDLQEPTPLRRLTQRLAAGMTELDAPDADIAQTWATAVSDLAALPLGLPEGPAAPIAGLPLYQALFGRDVLTTGWQALLATPELLRDSLHANAAHVGTRIDDWRDEEPGKMLHQAGPSPRSDTGRNPFDAYYGDHATPVDFVAMLGQYYLWTRDLETSRQLLPAAKRALTWLDRYADLDRDGLIEYRMRSEKGVLNQGWKDSDPSILDEHGRVMTSTPMVTCELQGYYYAALRSIAPVLVAAGDRAYAARLLRRARELRRAINERLWLEDEGTYALGLGPQGELLRSVTSNAGHLLTTAVPASRQAQCVARRLLEPDMFTGWGIRTLAASHPSYHPFSYHLGSVWPVEQATIAAGFGRYGLVEELHRLAKGFFDLAALFEDHRIPESVGGIARDAAHPHPGIYPKADSPQAWSASAVVMMVQALLGLRPLTPLGIVAVDPHLPEWLPSLTLRNVQLGHGIGDLHFRRNRHGRTTFRADVSGVRVVRVQGLRQHRWAH
jgi:glycogen debranching enzyme